MLKKKHYQKFIKHFKSNYDFGLCLFFLSFVYRLPSVCGQTSVNILTLTCYCSILLMVSVLYSKLKISVEHPHYSFTGV